MLVVIDFSPKTNVKNCLNLNCTKSMNWGKYFEQLGHMSRIQNKDKNDPSHSSPLLKARDVQFTSYLLSVLWFILDVGSSLLAKMVLVFNGQRERYDWKNEIWFQRWGMKIDVVMPRLSYHLRF